MTEHTATQNTSLDNLIQLLLNEGFENGLPQIAEMILSAGLLLPQASRHRVVARPVRDRLQASRRLARCNRSALGAAPALGR